MAITQKQIAQQLNISRSLVAQALKGYPSVSAETREKIQRAAAEMGYNENTNHAARSLIASRYGQRAQTGIIALMVISGMESSPQDMPFFHPLFRGIEFEAAGLGKEICLCWAQPGQLPRLIRDHGVDGVISLSNYKEDCVAIQQLNIPLVTYQYSFENCHSVMPDDRKGTYIATKYLLALGHRSIGFLGCETQDSSLSASLNLRLEGYLDALREYHIYPRRESIETSLKFPKTTELSYCSGCNECAACIGWQVLKDKNVCHPLTAVVCHNDNFAMGLIDHARLDGVDVPNELSVIGFDDTSQSYHFQPAISSISFDRYEMGRCAVRILQQVAQEQDGAHIQHRVFPVTLQNHATTAHPRCGAREAMPMSA